MKRKNMELFIKNSKLYTIKNIYAFYLIEIILSIVVILGSLSEKHYLFTAFYTIIVVLVLGYIYKNSKSINKEQYKIQIGMASVVALFLFIYNSVFFYVGLSTSVSMINDFVLLAISYFIIALLTYGYMIYSISTNDRKYRKSIFVARQVLFFTVILLISILPIIWIAHDFYNILVFSLSGLLSAILIYSSVKIYLHATILKKIQK